MSPFLSLSLSIYIYMLPGPGIYIYICSRVPGPASYALGSRAIYTHIPIFFIVGVVVRIQCSGASTRLQHPFCCCDDYYYYQVGIMSGASSTVYLQPFTIDFSEQHTENNTACYSIVDSICMQL